MQAAAPKCPVLERRNQSLMPSRLLPRALVSQSFQTLRSRGTAQAAAVSDNVDVCPGAGNGP